VQCFLDGQFVGEGVHVAVVVVTDVFRSFTHWNK
jgi:hypothetical protein